MRVTCSACKLSLLEHEGCDLCAGWRHLVVIESDDGARPDAAPAVTSPVALLPQAAGLCQYALDRLEAKRASGLRAADYGALSAVMRSLTGLIDAERKHRAEERRQAGELSVQERIELISEFFAELAPEHQADMLNALGVQRKNKRNLVAIPEGYLG
jgi:uncharacterized Zn finger protein (UPF0148 family)